MDGLSNYDIEAKAFVDVWSKLIPIKVSLLVRRLWKIKIPTKDSLIKRGVSDGSQIHAHLATKKRKVLITFSLNFR